MKKMLAKFIGFLLIICFTAGAAPALAAEPFAASAFEENPIYSGAPVESGDMDTVNNAISAVSGYYTDGEALYQQVKNHLLQREGSFEIKYVTGTRLNVREAGMNLVRKLFLAATDDSFSTQTDDGDYLRLAVAGYGYKNITEDKVNNSSLYYYTVTAQFTYFSTAAQEKQVAKTVSALVRELNAKPLSDYQRLLRVHQYICSHTTYNATANNTTVHAAYGALLGGKSACQGYAAAFYRVARALGYRARIITSSRSSGNHAWNMVALNGRFYYVDLTWDDENIDGKTGQSELQYFLVNEKNLQKNDSAKKEHTPDALYFNTAYFTDGYRSLADTQNYSSKDTKRLSNCVITFSRERQKSNAVIIRTADGKLLTEGIHYRVEPQRTLFGKRYWSVTGINGYSGTAQRQCGSGKLAARKPKLKQ